MCGLLVGFGLMFDKGQKQSSTLSCDSSYFIYNTGILSRCMGKPTICIGENKGADRFRSNCEADQRL